MNANWPRYDGSGSCPAIRRAGLLGAGYESRMSNHVNLTPQENSLIAEAHPDALARMDEKSLKELQSRLRQAREKNFSLLRRQGAARVEAEGARGSAEVRLAQLAATESPSRVNPSLTRWVSAEPVVWHAASSANREGNAVLRAFDRPCFRRTDGCREYSHCNSMCSDLWPTKLNLCRSPHLSD